MEMRLLNKVFYLGIFFISCLIKFKVLSSDVDASLRSCVDFYRELSNDVENSSIVQNSCQDSSTIEIEVDAGLYIDNFDKCQVNLMNIYKWKETVGKTKIVANVSLNRINFKIALFDSASSISVDIMPDAQLKTFIVTIALINKTHIYKLGGNDNSCHVTEPKEKACLTADSLTRTLDTIEACFVLSTGKLFKDEIGPIYFMDIKLKTNEIKMIMKLAKSLNKKLDKKFDKKLDEETNLNERFLGKIVTGYSLGCYKANRTHIIYFKNGGELWDSNLEHVVDLFRQDICWEDSRSASSSVHTFCSLGILSMLISIRFVYFLSHN